MAATIQPQASDRGTWTVLKIIRWTTDYLAGKGVETPRLDAEVMLADLLGLSRVELYLNFDRPLIQSELAGYRHRVRRRAAREPVAYITGKKEFFSLSFKVSPDVLIPRPETEILVQAALDLTQSRWAGDQLKLADVGAGCGTIAVTLAHHLPRAQVWAIDISKSALAIARANAVTHGVESRINFLRSDLLTISSREGLTFHLILANLPYIPRDDLAELPPEVRMYEPVSSLDGGQDGLDLVKRTIAQAADLLVPDGALLFEVGPEQAASVQAMGNDYAFPSSTVLKDLAGRDRVVILDRQAQEE